jgi:osmoprotectant transport system ATP-binding protein
MAEARAAAELGHGSGQAGNDSRWAVVVGEDDRLAGWIPLDPGLDGLVGDRLTPFAVEVPLGTSMRTALAEMLQRDVSWMPVTESARYLGVLTPDGLHAAMRRSVGGHAVES